MIDEPFALRQSFETGGVTTIHLQGELDLSAAPRVMAAIAANLAAGRRQIVDLTEVTFIDSAGIGAIVTPLRRALNGPAPISLRASPHSQPNRLLRMSGVAEVLDVIASDAESGIDFLAE